MNQKEIRDHDGEKNMKRNLFYANQIFTDNYFNQKKMRKILELERDRKVVEEEQRILLKREEDRNNVYFIFFLINSSTQISRSHLIKRTILYMR